jgi:hypothetical protein
LRERDFVDCVMEEMREVGREREMRSAISVLWIERRVVWKVV